MSTLLNEKLRTLGTDHGLSTMFWHIGFFLHPHVPQPQNDATLEKILAESAAHCQKLTAVVLLLVVSRWRFHKSVPLVDLALQP